MTLVNISLYIQLAHSVINGLIVKDVVSQIEKKVGGKMTLRRKLLNYLSTSLSSIAKSQTQWNNNIVTQEK